MSSEVCWSWKKYLCSGLGNILRRDRICLDIDSNYAGGMGVMGKLNPVIMVSRRGKRMGTHLNPLRNGQRHVSFILAQSDASHRSIKPSLRFYFGVKADENPASPSFPRLYFLLKKDYSYRPSLCAR